MVEGPEKPYKPTRRELAKAGEYQTVAHEEINKLRAENVLFKQLSSQDKGALAKIQDLKIPVTLGWDGAYACKYNGRKVEVRIGSGTSRLDINGKNILNPKLAREIYDKLALFYRVIESEKDYQGKAAQRIRTSPLLKARQQLEDAQVRMITVEEASIKNDAAMQKELKEEEVSAEIGIANSLLGR